MLLTITTTHRPATDLGFLLHKNPARSQTFDTGVGSAVVWYPEASEERCTAALPLDVDPVGLVRRGRDVSNFALPDYVNDRSTGCRTPSGHAIASTTTRATIPSVCPKSPSDAATAAISSSAARTTGHGVAPAGIASVRGGSRSVRRRCASTSASATRA